MRYAIEKHERYVVIQPLVSFLNDEGVAKLKGEFLIRNTTGQRNIVLDLVQVQQMTEGGIRMGLLASRLCQSLGGKFILLGLNQQVEHMLKVAKLDEHFIIVKKLIDAENLIFESEIFRELKRQPVHEQEI